MNLREFKTVLVMTHKAALLSGVRARAYEGVSGPGLGKSSVVEQYCAQLARDLGKAVGLLVRMLATLSGPDVTGFMMPAKGADGSLDSVFSRSPMMPTIATIHVFTPDGKHYLPGTWTGEMPEVGVVFLDEFGQGEDEVKKPAAEFLLKGEIGTTRLPLGWRVVAASNRLSDKSGVVRPLVHVVNRRGEASLTGSFTIWDEDFVQKLTPVARPHHMTVTFARKEPGIVWPEHTPVDGKPYCTARSLVFMDAELRALRSEEDRRLDRMPTDDLSREVCASWIGEAAAGQYFIHLKYTDIIPTFEEVCARPDTAKLPDAITQKDAQMVTAYMLSHHVTRETAGKVMRYMVRLGIEMQVMVVRNLTAQKELALAVVQVPEFQGWIAKHSDLLIASKA